MARKLKPQTPFAARLVEARGHMSRDEFSVLLNVPKTTLGGWERGANFPPPDALTKMAEILGVSLDWLIAGRETPRPNEGGLRPETAAAVDADLLAEVGEQIAEVYRQENARVYPRQLARLTAGMYADLVAAYDDPADRLVGLKGMLQQLRRDIRATSAPDAASSKRLA